MRLMLFTLLLLEGFITISVEVLAIRQLLPFFGGSVLITSVIIGTFLLFLAIGYWRGGAYSDNFFKHLCRNFTLSMLWVGVGLSYAFILFIYTVLFYQLSFPFLLSLTCYLLLVLAPVVYWLGQTIPLATNLFNQMQRVSRISGHALFLSTLGSFLGAILTSLLFFQYAGVAKTVVFNCVLLFMLIAYIRLFNRWSLFPLMWLFIALIFIGLLNVHYESSLFKTTNNYGNYQVKMTNKLDRLLQINLSNSSLLTQDKKGHHYIEFIRDLLFKQLHLTHRRILVIGAGGFSLTAEGSYQNEVTYVDIDPDIKRIAEEFFLQAPIQGTFIGKDARRYLRNHEKTFDVIVSDVYSNQSTIPEAMLTKEYFHALANHLNSHGLLIVNVIASPFFDDAYSQAVSNTIHSIFPYCAVIPLSWAATQTNVLYVCPKRQANPLIYQDDKTSATIDYYLRGL